MAGVTSLLLSTLDDMLAEDLRRFKFWLSNDLPEGIKPIGKGRLENRGVVDIVELMVEVHGEEGAVKVTLHALRKADQNELAQRLEKDHKRSGERFCPPDVRMVLVGKSGAGKSASGNTIMGRRAFKSEFSPGSVTRSSERSDKETEGRRVTVVDTPGIFDTSMPEEEVQREIGKCIALTVPGPHAFLLVLRLGRFTQEERNAVRWIQETFGDEAARYTMVLFTGGDQLDKPVQEFLSVSRDLQEVVGSCGGGYHVFNNRDAHDGAQVSALMRKVDEMVARNGGRHYTNEMYREAERRIREEEERRRREEEERKRQEEERIRAEEERKWKETEKRIREEEERKREEAERKIREEEATKRDEAEKRIREEAERRMEIVKQENENNRRDAKFIREAKRVRDDVRKFFR